MNYLSNFWRYLNLSLINCQIELDLSWLRNNIISEISRAVLVAGANPAATATITSTTFQINNAKSYVPVVTFSINNNFKLLENIKQHFRTTITT